MTGRSSFGHVVASPRRLSLVALGLGVAGLFAAGAAAGTPYDELATAEIRNVCESTGCPPPFLVVEGLPQAERITIGRAYAPDEYEITDPAGLGPKAPSCHSLSATVVRCSPIESRIVVNARHGDDLIAVGPAIDGLAQLQPGPGDDEVFVERDSTANAYVEGAEGNDHIFGGASTSRDPLTGIHGDLLVGREGRDVLRGRRGPDEIIGGPGADKAYGGPGRDRLMMTASVPGSYDTDRVIDCGPGRDVAFVNPKLDPAPINCERVRYMSGGSRREHLRDGVD